MFQPLTIGGLTARFPVLQGGMGVGVSLANLAAAVANAGGIGLISAVVPGFRDKNLARNYTEANIDALRSEIRKARSLTPGIIGVNIMVALTNFADMVRTAIEEKVDLIVCGAGLPLNLPEFLTPQSLTKLIPIVSSARAAKLIFKRWIEKFRYVPDAVVVEGPLSGGHQGFKYDELGQEQNSLEAILPEVVETVKSFEIEHSKSIPVIAAGGVFGGADMVKLQALGASGFQMGTRFIATEECDASPEFKQQYVEVQNAEDIIVIASPVGLPLRVIKTPFVDTILRGEAKPKSCPYHCLVTCKWQEVSFCIVRALIEGQKGNLQSGVFCCGSNGHRIDKITSVQELVHTIENEYESAMTSSAANR